MNAFEDAHRPQKCITSTGSENRNEYRFKSSEYKKILIFRSPVVVNRHGLVADDDRECALHDSGGWWVSCLTLICMNSLHRIALKYLI